MPLESATYVGDLNSANPTGSDQKQQGDDHIRLVKAALQATFPGLSGRKDRVVSASGSTSVGTTQNSVLVRAAGALTVTLSSAATYGNGFSVRLYAQGGDITLTPNGTDTVNGTDEDPVLQQGNMGVLFCDGTSWYLMVAPAPNLSTLSNITGNTTLTAADFSRIRTAITNDADITLPTSANCRLYGTIRVKSYTTKSIRILRNTSQTIDGASTDVRLPSYEYIELTYVGGNDWVITRKPTSYVGEVRVQADANVQLGWVAIGAAISRTTYSGLFAVCSTTYGPGDGSTTFNPPDGRGRALIGSGTGDQILTISGAATSGNAVTIGANNAWHTGMAVAVTNVSGFTGSLANGSYFIRRFSSTQLKFYTTLAAALQDGTPVTVGGTGGATLTSTLTARLSGEKIGSETLGQHGDAVGAHSHPMNISNVGSDDLQSAGANAWFTSNTNTSNNSPTATSPNMPPSLAIPMMVKT